MLFVLIYLLYAPTFFISLFDFHLEALVPALMLFGVYYFDKRNYKKFLIFLILTLSTIEFTPIITSVFAITVFLKEIVRERKNIFSFSFIVENRRIKYAFITFIISVSWLYSSMFIKKILNPYSPPMPSHFEHIFNPARWHEIPVFLLDKLSEKILYLVVLFAPLMFLPFLSILDLLPGLSWIGVSFLSNYGPYFHIEYQYSAFSIAFIFYAFVKSINKFCVRNGKVNVKRLKKILISTLIVSFTVFNLMIFAFNPRKPVFGRYSDEHVELLHRIISFIPENASVLTQNDIFPHLSDRSQAYLYPPSGEFEPDYILIDIKLQFYTMPPPEKPYYVLIPEFLEIHKNYGIYASADGIVLLRKDWNKPPIFYIPYNKSLNFRNIILINGKVVKDLSSLSTYVCYYNSNIGSLNWFYLHDIYPPGLYNVTFRFKVSKIVESPIINITISTNLKTDILSPITLKSIIINGSNFSEAGNWEDFGCLILLNSPIEIKINVTVINNKTDIFLDCIMLRQESIPFYEDNLNQKTVCAP